MSTVSHPTARRSPQTPLAEVRLEEEMHPEERADPRVITLHEADYYRPIQVLGGKSPSSPNRES